MGRRRGASGGAGELMGGVGHGAHGSAIASLLVVLLVAHSAGAAEPLSAVAASSGRATIEIDAVLDPEARTVTGSMRITLPTGLADPPTEALFFLYPEHLATEPVLDDILFERVFPGRFEGATMEITGAGVGLSTHRQAVATHRLNHEVPLLAVPLPEGAEPGERVVVELSFRTTFPRRYGTFGVVRRAITASGGWHPLPVARTAEGWAIEGAPAAADYRVRLSSPDDAWVVLGDAVAPPRPRSGSFPAHAFVPDAFPAPLIEALDEGRRRVTWAGSDRRWVALSSRPKAQQHNVPLTDGSTLTWVGRPLTRDQVRWLRSTADASRETLAGLGATARGRGFLLVEAPLRRRLVEMGDGVLYVSDRFLEADRPFWRYHDVHLARALLASDVEPAIVAREHPTLAEPVVDGVSWELVGDYLNLRWRNHVSLRRLLQRFSFFPQVETLLETPAFPFADQIFDNPWIVDPLREDLRRFNRPLRSGRTLFLRLGDRLGTATLRQTVLRSLGTSDAARRPLFDALTEDSGSPVASLVMEWLGPVPRVDYRIEGVNRDRGEGGDRVTTVTVRRETLEGPTSDDVVEIRLSPVLPFRKGTVWLRWQGQEEVATWEVSTRRRVGRVEIDPRGRLLEVDEFGLNLKQNNQRPGALRVSGFGYAGLSITGQGFEAYGLLNFRPKHNARDQLNLRASLNEQTRAGGGVTFAHFFGPPRWGLSLRHRVVVSGDVRWLNTMFRATEAPILLELSGGYVFESRTNSFHPTRGGRFSLLAFGGKDFALRDDAARPLDESLFAGLELSAIRLIKLSPHHVLALRGKAGFVVGDVEHSQFTLGGINDLRGIPERHLLVPARVLGAVEWRHLFFKDADLALPFQRVRALQGAVFLEGALSASAFGEPPSAQDLHVSVGYGFRWFVDWLGVFPAAWGMDFAFSPGAPPGRLPIGLDPRDWPEVPFQVYFMGAQSF